MDRFRNKIYNCECIQGMAEMPDKSVDCIICDLPYGTTACGWDCVIPFDRLWSEYRRIRKPSAPVLLFGAEPFSSAIRLSNLREFRYDWYWKKSYGSNFLNLKKQPYFVVETISTFYAKAPVYNPQMIRGRVEKPSRRKSGEGTQQDYGISQRILSGSPDGLHYPSNVIDMPFSNANRIHPTQKPVDLVRYLIRTYTDEGMVVLDNCMGSGTTAVACIREKRHFVGFELNGEYYRKASERIAVEMMSPTLF